MLRFCVIVILLVQIFLISANQLKAQPIFTLNSRYKVTGPNGVLSSPWAGAFNSSQVNEIRLDNDSLEDLVLFDRATNKISTFLRVNNQGTIQYVPAPEYEKYFPLLESWVLFRDYDCDGLKDIYTSSPNGISVYKNMAAPPGLPLYLQITDDIIIPSQSGGGRTVNLQINSADIPEVLDYDGDGDLDILAIYYQGISMVFYQNYSKERTGSCGLDYDGHYECFGKYLLATTACGNYPTGQACRFAAPNDTTLPNRVLHNGTGSTAVHIGSDTLIDLLMGDALCNGLYYLKNVGTRASAFYQAAVPFPPGGGTIASMYVFPTGSQHDIDLDGKKDVLVTLNTSTSDFGQSDFKNSLWYYRNTGTFQSPSFNLETKSFLQEQMIEVGEEASPAFADYDADGDLDLFIGNKGRYDNNKHLQVGSITLYKNNGTATQPEFQYVTDNWLGILNFNINTLRPVFADLDGNGSTDFILVGTSGNRSISFRYFKNNAPTGSAFVFDTAQVSTLAYSPDPYDFPLFKDLDSDGLPDMLVGKYDGRLQYYQNFGTIGNPDFRLKNNTTCGISANFYHQNLTLTVADFDKDGNDDLITGDYYGNLRYYSHFIPHLYDSIPADSNVVWNKLGRNLTYYQFGNFMAPSAADLDNDHYPDLLTGTAGGGLVFLYNNTNYPLQILPKLDEQFEIYPNPARNYLNIVAKCNGNILIVCPDGRIVNSVSVDSEQSVHKIDLENIPAGFYFVKIYAESGLITRKLVVIK